MANKYWIKYSLGAILTIWILIIFSPSFSAHLPVFRILELYANYTGSLICHQHPDKLFHFWEFSSVVCFRCTGIYFGAFLAATANLFLEKSLNTKYLLLGFFPMALDVLFLNLKLYTYSQATAFFSGLILGCASFFYLYIAIENLFLELEKRKTI